MPEAILSDGFVDEVKITTDEDGFHLLVYTSEGQLFDFRLGVPEQLAEEVDRCIRPWMQEREDARCSFEGRRAVDLAAYEPNDPKRWMLEEELQEGPQGIAGFVSGRYV